MTQTSQRQKGERNRQLLRILLLGAPGAGKGTLADLMVKQWGIIPIATGDLLRQEVREGSRLGRAADDYMKRGELVPDTLVIETVRQRLSAAAGGNGFVFDGFPRTLAQAEALDGLLAELSLPLQLVFDLQVSHETVVRRLGSRRLCRQCGAIYNLLTMPPQREGICDACGGELYQRSDDREEVILSRLQVYQEQTEPLIAYYRDKGILHHLDSNCEAQETFREAAAVIAETADVR